MFIVGPVGRNRNPDKPEEFTAVYPVVFEDTERAYCHDAVAHRDSRELAQELADELNDVLSEPPTEGKGG